MSGSNRLGPLVTIGNIQEACLILAGRDGHTSTTGYLPDYLYDAALADGKAGDWIALPRSWRRAPDVEKWPSQQLPAVFTHIPGTSAVPRQRGDGTYSAVWEIHLVAVLGGRDADDTDAQASIYEAGLRLMFMQQAGNLPGLKVERATWLGTDRDRYPQAANHDPSYIRAVQANFDVELLDVANARQGIDTPSTPPLGPAGAYPTADTVTVDLEKTPT